MANQELKSSSERIGQLYPVLVDRSGNIIDGEHRIDADPNWRRVTLENIETEKQRVIARIVCNNLRRTVLSKEKTDQLGRLAEIYLSEGTERGMIAYRISEETGMSYRWVARYLPHEYKDNSQSERASSAARLAAGTGKLLQLSDPPRDRFVEVGKYTNASYAVYMVRKSLHERVEKASEILGTTPEVFIQNTIEEKLTDVTRHAEQLQRVEINKEDHLTGNDKDNKQQT